MFDLRLIGKMCQQYRKECGYLQRDVAQDCYCSIENVSAFERGRNDSAILLLWYFEHGMEVSDGDNKTNT